MDNQHKLIKGYRDLTQQEIDLINRVKAIAEEVSVVVDDIIQYRNAEYLNVFDTEDPTSDATSDLLDSTYELTEWAKDGKRDLQVGFMKLVRSIAAPTTF